MSYHFQSFNFADEDNEKDKTDENVVGISKFPNVISLRIEVANHLQNPIHTHHEEQLNIKP